MHPRSRLIVKLIRPQSSTPYSRYLIAYIVSEIRALSDAVLELPFKVN